MFLFSPGIMDGVSDETFRPRLHVHEQLHRLRLRFFPGIRFLLKFPVCVAVKMLDDLYVDGFGLVIANPDFEGFIDPGRSGPWLFV